MRDVLAISYCLPPMPYPQSVQVGRMLRHLSAHCRLWVVGGIEPGAPEDPGMMPGFEAGFAGLTRLARTPAPRRDAIGTRLLPMLYQRPDPQRLWMRRARAEILRVHRGRRFHAIATFASPASTNLLGAALARDLGVPWVAHNSDPWADNPLAGHSPLMRGWIRRAERASFAAAARLVFTSEETAELYRRRYPAWSGRIAALNHSFAADAPRAPGAGVPGGPTRLRYLGSFYGARSPAPLFAALDRLAPELRGRLAVEIVGGGRRTAAEIEAAGLGAVVTRVPSVGYAESLRLMAEAGLLLVIDAPAAHSVFFPSKLADYLGSLRPVLGISPPGTTRRILGALGQPCCDPTDIDGIAAHLAAVARGELPAPPPPEAIAPFHPDAVASRLAGLLGL